MNKTERLNSQFVQFVYEQVFNISYDTRFNRLKARVFNKLFYFILKSGDPLIEHDIAGFRLLIPFSHQLPFILKNYPCYSSNLGRIAKYVQRKYDDMRFIDIGANIGDSIAILRKEADFPILCIEGDEQFFSVLAKNATLFSNINLLNCYVGEKIEIIKLANKKEGGTAHLIDDNEAHDVIQIRKLSDALQEAPYFLDSKMIKVDTDGFDGKIIRGATDFISKAKPIIFFEYDPFFLNQQGDDGISIFNVLREVGYEKLLIYDNFGDLMLSTVVNNSNLLEEIHLYFSGRGGSSYCDICVFHSEDDELFEEIKHLEIKFFKHLKQ